MVAKIKRQEEFEGVMLNVIEENGEEWLTGQEIGDALGFSEPRKAVLKILERNRSEFEGLARVVSMTTRTTTGGFRPNRLTVFNAQGAYLVAIHSDVPKAKALRRFLARFMAHDRHQLKEHILKLKEENQRLTARLRALPAPGPDRRQQKQVQDLSKQLKETKKAALDLIEIKDRRIRLLSQEKDQALQAAQARPLLHRGRQKRLQHHLYRMLEELGSFRSIITELASHLSDE